MTVFSYWLPRFFHLVFDCITAGMTTCLGPRIWNENDDCGFHYLPWFFFKVMTVFFFSFLFLPRISHERVDGVLLRRRWFCLYIYFSLLLGKKFPVKECLRFPCQWPRNLPIKECLRFPVDCWGFNWCSCPHIWVA